ncbi:MAG: GTP-binding protein, partial [Stellaceae bacterium]
LVISKTDLTPVSEELDAALAALNPNAERIIGQAASDPALTLFASQFRHHRASGEDDPGFGHAHTHGIDSFAVILDGPVGRLDFAKALGGLARERGSDLLRVKGLVAFADAPSRPAVIQAAQHAMFAPEWLDDWPDADRRSRLVFIVHDIPRDEILAHFAFASPAVHL